MKKKYEEKKRLKIKGKGKVKEEEEGKSNGMIKSQKKLIRDERGKMVIEDEDEKIVKKLMKKGI